MSLFQKPTPRIEDIYDREEAPHIPNRILYYFAVVMSDPQMCLIIKELQVCCFEYVMFVVEIP